MPARVTYTGPQATVGANIPKETLLSINTMLDISQNVYVVLFVFVHHCLSFIP
jgi:hypothetical protein